MYLITGATGLVGSEILKLCEQQKIVVHYLTTRKSKIKNTKYVKGFYWNPSTNEIDITCLEGVTVIIHLAGSTVAKRWTSSYKEQIMDSRIQTANLLFNTLKNNKHSVSQFVSASAVGIYSDSLTSFCKEETSNEVANDFLGEVVLAWENVSNQFKLLNIKVAKIRIGLVLSNEGGAFPKMVSPIKMFVGSAFGSGDQWQSWIHLTDIARIFLFVANKQLEGVFNGVAPNPVNQNKLVKTAADILEKPLWLPNIPKVVVEFIFGEMSILLLSSQRVSSKKIKEAGFVFKFNTIEAAAENILRPL